MTAPNDPASPNLPPLRDVIATHGIDARRGLGQHFLFDMNLTRRIARAADVADRTVIEIGPGPGGLTRALLELGARRVIAIERDDRCIAALAGLRAAYGDRVEIIAGDALTIDIASVAPGADKPKIVANLPYNIATALLIGWLRRIDSIAEMVLMFQREVADRLIAPPGGRAYGRLSVMTQWLCAADRLFDVPRQAFVPPPKVMSSVVRLTPRQMPLAPARADLLEKVTAAAFGQRRKMLRRALKTLPVDPARLLAAADIAPDRRAETLDIPAFCALARELERASF